jgi:hypothetical protein
VLTSFSVIRSSIIGELPIALQRSYPKGNEAKQRIRVFLPKGLHSTLAKSALFWPSNERCVSTVFSKTLRQRGFALSPK